MGDGRVANSGAHGTAYQAQVKYPGNNEGPLQRTAVKAGQLSQEYLFARTRASIEKEIATILTGEGALKSAGSAPASAGSAISRIGSTLAGAAGLAYGGYEIVKNWGTRDPLGRAVSGATAGAGIAALGSGVGAGALSGSWAGPIGMAVGAVAGGLLGFISAGKHKDQLQRDAVRDALQNSGIIDSRWTIGLADGSRYDIGKDGRPSAEFGNRRPYELDLADPLVRDVIGLVNPFVAVLVGGDKKLQSDFTGYFVNAALSNAGGDIEKARSNVLAIFGQMKIAPEEVVSGLGQLAAAGSLTREELQAMLGGFRELFSEDPYVLKAPEIGTF